MMALLVAGFVGLFSETALNIALGDLGKIFEVGPTTVQWLATGYFLTLGILIPVTGILMQKFTTRQMFFTSITLTLIGTILAALSPSFAFLLAGRILQAAGLAINLPLTQNVIFTIFPPNKRGAAMGIMGLVMLAGPALGPTIAGLILDTLSWEWIFWVQVPFVLLSLIIGIFYVPNVNEVRKISLDILSVILSTIGFGGIVYGFSVSGDNGWTSPVVIGSIIIGLVGVILFSMRQMKMEQPMMNLRAFKYPLFVLGVFMSFITFFNMLSLLVVLPMFMQLGLLMAAFATGLVLLPGSLLNCIFAPLIGKMFDKYGPKAVITPGTILVVIGYALYVTMGTDTATWMIVVTHIIWMLGVGMVLASTQTNTLNSLPREYYPDGIALTQTVQQVAGAMGIAIIVALLSAKQESSLALGNELTEATASGSSFVFMVGLALAIVNFILSLFMKKPGEVELKA
ncbi:DHA2 family efflux MFS transporter permease subunit [Psychrobacillus sp. OK032]|uniref:DHA2 family efflux MFS transporter permease subunit n=1 Tax=Psychrobacillus sp. OK032 TaxID=1884358 RepID=UPI000B861EA8|nr:DHA2 family efflux MFS transporter permease subunit [Psychrobacillus sp. OK032]